MKRPPSRNRLERTRRRDPLDPGHAPVLDTRILNGTVIDGRSTPAHRADIGIRGDTLVAVGDLSRTEARRTFDLAGERVWTVCPGFIDAHSHSDTYLLIEPRAPSKIYQGITTEICGNCGASAAPIGNQSHLPSDWADKEYPGRWTSVEEYRGVLEAAGPAPNVVLLAGHNTLRRCVMGHDNRPATADEMRTMESLLSQALEQGARGFSTGLIYPPGLYAPREEIHALAAICARHGGIYTSHMRSESKQLLAAIDETLGVAAETGCTVQISHLKAAGPGNWDLLDPALERIHEAQRRGLRVAADRYPYTSSWTELDSRLPDWALAGGRDVILGRLRDAGTRSRIRHELVESHSEDYWATVIIGGTAHPDHLGFRGKFLSEAAVSLDMAGVDAFLHLLDSNELRISAFFCGMSEDNMRRVLKEPYVMLGTDASLRAPEGPFSLGTPHPRAYGSFPRFLRMVREEALMPLEAAVRKMTSLAAASFGLADRGVVAEGKKADLVILDADTVCDTSTYAEPHRLAEGILAVFVNGVLTLHEGHYTGNRAGKFL